MTKNRILWIVQSLLALEFLLAGIMKFVLPADEMTKQLPLPIGFLRFIGVAEIVGAFGLILPAVAHPAGSDAPCRGGTRDYYDRRGRLDLQHRRRHSCADAFHYRAHAGVRHLRTQNGGCRMSNTFNVQRAANIQAAPEAIFPLVNDFHNWHLWSPWEKLDPAMKKTYSGAPSGKGAIYEWSGNSKAGQGRMEITESTPPFRIAIKLDFVKPFEGHNIAEFSLQPQNGSTDVVWSMSGPEPFIFRLMKIFFSMDKMLGKDFEAGLDKLKCVAEEQSKTRR